MDINTDPVSAIREKQRREWLKSNFGDKEEKEFNLSSHVTQDEIVELYQKDPTFHKIAESIYRSKQYNSMNKINFLIKYKDRILYETLKFKEDLIDEMNDNIHFKDQRITLEVCNNS